jgi:hypothetical protein
VFLATIDGVVTDAGLAPLRDATASILGSAIHVVTGANGRFRIVALPAGQYILVVRHLGFAPTSVAVDAAAGDTLRLSFTLDRIASPLDTVLITAARSIQRLAEFEARRKAGFGQFMTQGEIDSRNSVFVADLLISFRSVQVRLGRFGRSADNLRAGCAYDIYQDGVLLPNPVNLDDLPSPKELAGIELYAGPSSMPLQYKNSGHAGFCGVILIWTRGG